MQSKEHLARTTAERPRILDFQSPQDIGSQAELKISRPTRLICVEPMLIIALPTCRPLSTSSKAENFGCTLHARVVFASTWIRSMRIED
jgi:hypothetical protein